MARLVVYNKRHPDELCHYGVKGMKWGMHIKAGLNKVQQLAGSGGGGGGDLDEEEELDAETAEAINAEEADAVIQDKLNKAEKYKEKAEEYSTKAAEYRAKETQYRHEAGLNAAKAEVSKFHDQMTISGKKQSEYYKEQEAKSIAKANKMEAKAIKYDKKASKSAKKGEAWIKSAEDTKRLKARNLDNYKKKNGEWYVTTLFGKPRYY